MKTDSSKKTKAVTKKPAEKENSKPEKTVKKFDDDEDEETEVEPTDKDFSGGVNFDDDDDDDDDY